MDQQNNFSYVFLLDQPSTPVFSINSTLVGGTVNVIGGRNIVIKCESSSNPGPSYEWTNNKTPDKASGQKLDLQIVNQSDEKSYLALQLIIWCHLKVAHRQHLLSPASV